MGRIAGWNWTRIGLINFLIVSFYGVVMRYKIGFAFPFFEQKNLQNAHSHFAFIGWVTLILMVYLIKMIEDRLSFSLRKRLYLFLFANLICAYSLLISFTLQGYGVVSIILSVISIFISYGFAFTYYLAIRSQTYLWAKKWILASLVFLVLSSFGTFYLSYITVTKQITEYAYLASIYWYLHFQYNGWFFFACAGLFVNYLQEHQLTIPSLNRIFWAFVITCIPAYGLSVLWADIPTLLYIIICVAAVIQFYGIVLFIFQFRKSGYLKILKWNKLTRFILFFVGFSLLTKFALQLGSTVPFISKFAFGFRPIVIAYLHLVLLAFTSLFLVGYAYFKSLISFSRINTIGIFFLAIGILLNELILAIQGIGSFQYIPIPYANELLFFAAALIFVSLILLNFKWKNAPRQIYGMVLPHTNL